MATKPKSKVITVMSKLGEQDLRWEPEEGSYLDRDVIPAREPLVVTLFRVGARTPQIIERVVNYKEHLP